MGKIIDNGNSRNNWMKFRLLYQNQLFNGPILTLFESLVVFLLIAIALGMTEQNDQEAINGLLEHLSPGGSVSLQVLLSSF